MSIAYTSSMWRYCILYSWDADLWYPDLTRVYIWFHYTTNCLVFKFTYVIISHLIFIIIIYNVIQCGFNGIVRQGAQLNLVSINQEGGWIQIVLHLGTNTITQREKLLFHISGKTTYLGKLKLMDLLVVPATTWLTSWHPRRWRHLTQIWTYTVPGSSG